MLRKLGYWAPLDKTDEAALLALPHKIQEIDAHSYIVREGDRPAHSCLMLSGYSIRHKTVMSGARQIVSIHITGDLVDLQNSLLRRADHSVQTLVRSKVAFIPRETIIALAQERPNVGFAMWYDTLVDASVFREWIANVGRRDARTRMAHLLCEFAVRLRVAGLADDDYELPMTQEQLADATGMTSVHANRTIRGLEQDGLIQRATSRMIHIENWKDLASAGEFDRAYLHLRENEPALD
jgi:CRP-like cAMP-binding protein